MDADKVIVAYHGTWDGCTYRNGKEEMIFVPSLRTSLEAFLDHVHTIVGSNQAIFKYVLHCLESHENRLMKWRILFKQDLERAKTLFKTPKFFVTVEQKRLPTSSPPINGGKNFTDMSSMKRLMPSQGASSCKKLLTSSPPINGGKNFSNMKHLMPMQGASSCKKLPTSSPPINGDKNFSDISNMKHPMPSQGASGCNFPKSNAGKSHSRFPQLSVPPFLYRESLFPSSPPVKPLEPNTLAQNLAKSNKVPKVVEGQNASRKFRSFGSFGDDMLFPYVDDPVVSDSPYRGCDGLGLDYGLADKTDLSYEPERDEDEDSTDDEDYDEEESFEEVVSKLVYDHFGWEHDDYFVPDEDVILPSWPYFARSVQDESVIGDLHERVLRNRSIPMVSTFEEWRPMALSHMLGSVVVPTPRAYEPLLVGESEMSGGRFVTCSRCWDEGHTRANCTCSVSLRSPTTDPGFWSSDEVTSLKPKRRCGICREVGHTRRTCPGWD